jgi:hypothetical protein
MTTVRVVMAVKTSVCVEATVSVALGLVAAYRGANRRCGLAMTAKSDVR